ncbi:chemotaxis protein CheA [Ketobacter sp.]|uniref:chemotaxis protein CheA n=1 Tax=Ketobacter sp. TaxID=2083498 RepID=UPI000F1783DF|nr:chemotaxis protein CheA [Ketobacter sp.]RLT92560.1 MAG: chemotaxis protein CheA [Ketobacter sp.]
MSIDLSQFHQVFFEESFEGLQVMESSLLELDCENVDSETINSIFRAAHSIKGSSSTFGFAEVAEFTHVLETLLDQVREGARRLLPEHVDLLLQSVDCLRGMLTALQAHETVDTAQSCVLTQAFNDILEGRQPTTPSVPRSDDIDAEQSVADATHRTDVSAGEQDAAADAELITWHIRFVPDINLLRTGNEPLRMFRELAEMGELEVQVDAGKVPDLTGLHPEECHLSWDLYLTTTRSQAEIEEIFEWVVDDSDINITATAGVFSGGVAATAGTTQETAIAEAVVPSAVASVSEAPATPSPATAVAGTGDSAAKPQASKPAPAAGAAKSSESTSIRVAIEKIDNLVNLVGELVITQSMLGQLGSEFDVSKLQKLQEGLAQLEHNTRELQESVMRIRMLPISFTFSRFPRMVRDLSKQLGKKIELKLLGEQTELDKTVMEKIGDPLVHLVRNALDHGLETPTDRRAAGKPETGTITLNAFHQGGNIIIEIMDDGKGLNRDKILAKARNNGVIGAEEVLSDEQIQELIFQPGFSTAEQVTDVSGRGVGMDVVRRNIQELNGSIEVKSIEGEGSTFTIRLPLTLAILDGQLIDVGRQTFIIPLVSIVESLQPDMSLINHVAGGCDVFRLRDEYIPIIKLWEIFGVEPRTTNLAESLLVVVEVGNAKVALVVDDLLGQQQVVIKSMETNYKKVDGISGATILGDGTVSLILDITDLIHMAGVHQQSKNGLKLVASKTRAA